MTELATSSPAMRTYEATILVKAAPARTDFDGSVAAVRQTYESEGAIFIELEKWEERSLAYPIDGETSALYLNAYFTADPAIVERIERRARLGDAILRQLIISRPGRDFEQIKDQRSKAAANAAAAAIAAAAAAASSAGSYES